MIIFRDVKYQDLEALIDFMYQGEVNVLQEQLSSFLNTAELLAVQGLTDGSSRDSAESDTSDVSFIFIIIIISCFLALIYFQVVFLCRIEYCLYLNIWKYELI